MSPFPDRFRLYDKQTVFNETVLNYTVFNYTLVQKLISLLIRSDKCAKIRLRLRV